MLTALEFVAHQLYMESCVGGYGGGYGVKWSAMRTDLQQNWLAVACKVVEEWAADDERAKQARDAAFDGIRVERVP